MTDDVRGDAPREATEAPEPTEALRLIEAIAAYGEGKNPDMDSILSICRQVRTGQATGGPPDERDEMIAALQWAREAMRMDDWPQDDVTRREDVTRHLKTLDRIYELVRGVGALVATPIADLTDSMVEAAANIFMSYLPNNNRATSDEDRHAAREILKAARDQAEWNRNQLGQPGAPAPSEPSEEAIEAFREECMRRGVGTKDDARTCLRAAYAIDRGAGHGREAPQ